MSENITTKSIEILNSHHLCDNCLGRLFGMLGTEMTNEERGRSIRIILFMHAAKLIKNQELKEATKIINSIISGCDFSPAKKLAEKEGLNIKISADKCHICDNIFCNLNNYLEKSMNELRNYEFNTILVGTKIKDEYIEREDNLRSKYNIIWGESIKSELNREIGKLIIKKFNNIDVDFKNPEMVIEYTIPEFDYSLNVNPIFLFGYYKKLIRGIPQTKWYCKNCKGEGCERCNFTGKMYDTSVEELISKPLIEQLKGTDGKFHGAGREDIDAVMLGTGRPFVLELKGVKKRNINLKEVEILINKENKKKVEVHYLKWVSRDVIRKLKALSKITKKTYKAIVKLAEKVDDQKIIDAEKKLTNCTIEQETPLRVIHRRRDKIREKKVYLFKIKKMSAKKLEIIIEGQGGLYIKELISGDEGRTRPNLSEILNIKSDCIQLDVLNVDFPEEVIFRRRNS
jgi:tRNA pseudouridine synthase 10